MRCVWGVWQRARTCRTGLCRTDAPVAHEPLLDRLDAEDLGDMRPQVAFDP